MDDRTRRNGTAGGRKLSPDGKEMLIAALLSEPTRGCRRGKPRAARSTMYRWLEGS